MTPYIEERIRRKAPTGCSLVVGSTPVVAFGDAQIARVATLGLNPSRAEFLDDNGELLSGKDRRLATRDSVGVSDLSTADTRTVRHVLDDCNRYFDADRNAYWGWFDQLSPVLGACGAAYRDRSACHLDLVQWATDPTWGSLPGCTRKRLITEDAKFLAQQLQQEHLRLLLVNGASVLRQLRRMLGSEMILKEGRPLDGLTRVPSRLFGGRIFGRVKVVAWSANLQSSFGITTEFRQELPRRVAGLVV